MSDIGRESKRSKKLKHNAAGFLALITSTSTLFCCVLPATITAIAGGSAVASFISVFPWLKSLSHYEIELFLAAGLFLVLSGILIYRPRGKIACSITGDRGCETPGRFQKLAFWTALIIFLVGTIGIPMMRILGIS